MEKCSPSFKKKIFFLAFNSSIVSQGYLYVTFNTIVRLCTLSSKMHCHVTAGRYSLHLKTVSLTQVLGTHFSRCVWWNTECSQVYNHSICLEESTCYSFLNNILATNTSDSFITYILVVCHSLKTASDLRAGMEQ